LYFTVTGVSKHEWFKRVSNYCNKKQLLEHFCYVAQLKPSKLTDRCMYVFSDTYWTKDLEKHVFFEHNPKLIHIQQLCSKCEEVDDLRVDCKLRGKRIHFFWAVDP
jgi:hypothetical protein